MARGEHVEVVAQLVRLVSQSKTEAQSWMPDVGSSANGSNDSDRSSGIGVGIEIYLR